MKVLFLFIFASLTLLEASDWWVYTYEDVGTLKAVYNYLAMVGDDAGYNQTIQTVLMAGMSFVIVLKFLDLTAVPKYFVTVTGVMLVIFGTTATVHITNVKSYTAINPQVDNYAVVDNVPFIFAVLTSAFSTIGYNGAELVETIFTSIGDNAEVMENSFLKTGHLGGFKVLEKLNSIDPMLLNDDTKAFSALYTDYLNSCIFGIAYVLKPDLKNVLLTQPDLFGYISPITSEVDEIKRIATQQILKSDGVVTTCSAQYAAAKVKYDLIKADNKLYSAAKSLISRVTSNVDNSASSTINMVTNSTLTDAQSKITTYLMNNGIRSAFESSWMSYGVGTTSSTQAAYGTGLAVAQMQLAGKIKSSSAGIMIPTMHSVLQALMYVLFPFVLIVQLFIGGIKILQNYVLGLLWLEFWVPSFSVLNYFTYKEAQTQSVDKLINLTNNVNGPDGLMTLANQSEILNTIANQAAIAGDMYWMIPAIAGFILFASFQSMTGITSAAAGLVGQYSSNQTLEGERAKFAAYDQINSELKKDNPMYTGNIGTVSAMAAQSSITSSASMAAGRFMASGGNINDIGSMTRADMFGGAKTQTASATETKALTNGGSIGSAMNTIENNANAKAFNDMGSSNAINLGNGMLGKIEKGAEVKTTEEAYTGNAKYGALQKNFNDIRNGLEISTNVKENSTVEGLSRQLNLAGGEKSLVFLNSLENEGETAKIMGQNNVAQKRGETYAGNQMELSAYKADSDLSKIDGAKDVGAASDGGLLTEKGGTAISSTSAASLKGVIDSIDYIGDAKKYVDNLAVKDVANTAALSGEIEQAKNEGTSLQELSKTVAVNETSTTASTLEAKKNYGAITNEGALTDQARTNLSANVGKEHNSTTAQINTLGGETNYVNTYSREAGKDAAVINANQNQGDINGGYEAQATSITRKQSDEQAFALQGAKDAGLLTGNGSYNDLGRYAMTAASRYNDINTAGQGVYADSKSNNELIQSSIYGATKTNEDNQNLAKNAVNAFENNLTNSPTIESFANAQSNNYNIVDKNGAKVEIINDENLKNAGKVEEKITDNGVSKVYKDADGKVQKSELNGDMVNSHRKVNDSSETNNSSKTTDSSIVFKDNFMLEAQTISNINGLFKRVEGSNDLASYANTMASINNADSVKNYFSNPLAAVTDTYASIRASVTNSNLVDGAERVDFKPDTINFLENRQNDFFNFEKKNK